MRRPGLAGRPVRTLTALLAVVLLAGAEEFRADDLPEASETRVKAAFLVNFPKYVDWPADAFARSNSPIVLAVFGEADVAEDLRKMTEGKTVNGRRLEFRHVNTEAECAHGCHILFISAAEGPRTGALLNRIQGASILTVGDSDDFLDMGGVINLALRDRKIRIKVNLAAAHQARVVISSKLLAVADAVKGKSD